MIHGFGFAGAGFQIGPGVGEVLAELDGKKPADLVKDRRQKFLHMGSKALA